MNWTFQTSSKVLRATLIFYSSSIYCGMILILRALNKKSRILLLDSILSNIPAQSKVLSRFYVYRRISRSKTSYT
jgi:hypothetical protein